MTSSVLRLTLTALDAGNTNSLEVTIPNWGYSKTQKNRFPVTFTVIASSTELRSRPFLVNVSKSSGLSGFGTRFMSTTPWRVGTARITKMSVDAIIRKASTLEFPCDWGGTSIASSLVFARYFHNTNKRHPPTAQKRKMVIQTDNIKISYWF